jgi:hypothetical protein
MYLKKPYWLKLAFYFFVLLLLVNAQFVCAASEFPPKLYSADKTKPLEIIAEKIWTAADEEPKDGHNVISNEKYHNPDHLPLGQGTRYIATITPQADKGAVKLILDYAGTAESMAKHPDNGVVVVNVALICPESPELDDCQRSKGAHSWTQDMTYPFYQNKPSQDSQKPALYTSHSYLEYDFAPNKPVTIAISFNAPAYATTHQLKTTLIYGDYALTPPPMFKMGQGYLKIGNFARAVIWFSLLCLAFLWLIKLNSHTRRNDEAPRTLGILLTIWSALLIIAGSIGDSMSYYLIIGAIFAYSALYFYLGKHIALWLWGLGLAAAWAISILEVGFVFKPLFTQVGFISLLSLYIFSNRVTQRLDETGIINRHE